MVLNILSACKAEERGVAIATASDDNAADGKIGSARCPNCQVASTLVYCFCGTVKQNKYFAS
ncbi:MAG: hypothetical protein HFE76_13240 [Firmicutes bacterium]|nr:hypothetical protein [Bacillota bacterium]